MTDSKLPALEFSLVAEVSIMLHFEKYGPYSSYQPMRWSHLESILPTKQYYELSMRTIKLYTIKIGLTCSAIAPAEITPSFPWLFGSTLSPIPAPLLTTPLRRSSLLPLVTQLQDEKKSYILNAKASSILATL